MNTDAPNGNASVTFALGNQNRVVVAVFDNVFMTRPSGQVRAVEFRKCRRPSRDAYRTGSVGACGSSHAT